MVKNGNRSPGVGLGEYAIKMGWFWRPKIDPQGGLVGEFKNRSFLGVEKEPKNALKNGLKME